LVREFDDKMSMMLKISAEAGFLHVNAMGDFSLAEAKRTFIEVLEAATRDKVGKVLLDGRALTGKPEMMERFYYGEFAAQAVAKFTARGVFPTTEFAYVLEVPVLDPARFGETVARNRGMRVKSFDNLLDALQWLGIASARSGRRED
jgi:hypothetical protein